jgi:alpha-galactosidase/6-phospho-beta-glucosidase family protein
MLPTKIVVIGAASASFGINTLSTLMRSRMLQGSQIALVDRNDAALEQIVHLAEKMNHEWHSQMRISSHNHHLAALEGAEFVVNSIEVPPREALWRSDFEIPLKYGVRQPYAENGGPGGFAHAARNIGPVLEITRDMESICPQALLINFTNPMTRICDAVNRYSRIKVVGLCHQILVGYSLVGIALAKDLDFLVPPGISGSHADPVQRQLRHQIKDQAQTRLAIDAAGINHFTWMLALHDRQTGEDLYPRFAKRWAELPSGFEPLTRLVYKAFGYFPIAGDEHICEYLPWVSDPVTRPWEKFDLSLYDWDSWSALREQGFQEISRMTKSQETLATLFDADSEGALEVIENIAGSGTHYHLAFNLPNRGQISNLPVEAIVETPGIVSGEGVRAISMGALPEPIAELCRRELSVTRLCVDAAVQGDRQIALQCLLLDPVIRDLDVAQHILDDYLSAYRIYLPKFWE